MGYSSSGGTKGLGVFDNTPQTTADFNQTIELIAQMGNYYGGITEAERDAITGDALYVGLMVFNTTSEVLELYDGSGWVAAREDTGWVSLTLVSSWVNYGSGYVTAQYRKINGVVHVRGVIKSGTTTGGTVVATLPAGYRPSSHIVVPAWASAGPASVEVLSSGDLVCGDTGLNATRSSFNFSFAAD